MSDTTYNGWTNYETWNVALWLDNEEGSYNYWREQAEDVVKDNGDNKDAAVYELCARLESEVKDNAPDLGASTYADLLNAALSEVDWYEIAQHYVDEAVEAIAA